MCLPQQFFVKQLSCIEVRLDGILVLCVVREERVRQKLGERCTLASWSDASWPDLVDRSPQSKVLEESE